jgi:hypothetical protein
MKRDDKVSLKGAASLQQRFGLVYLFIQLVTHVTLGTSITDYNLYITTLLIMYEHPPNIIK